MSNATAQQLPTTKAFDIVRTSLTTSFNRGMSLEAVAALLGHRSPKMTCVYARISSEVRRRTVLRRHRSHGDPNTANASPSMPPRPLLPSAPPRQRPLHPARRVGLPIPDHLRGMRLLRDQRRVHPHPATPTPQRARAPRPSPGQDLRRTRQVHRVRSLIICLSEQSSSDNLRAVKEGLDQGPHRWFHSTAQARRITRVTPAERRMPPGQRTLPLRGAI